jgi:CRISPR/Cas system CMR-associated protein Cmr5 small subunit
MNKEDYSNYLNHPKWQQKRDHILLKYGKKCSRCPSTNNLEVHHKTYSVSKLPWEYPDENFIVLCEKCHRNHHGIEYTLNRCKGCGREISVKFDYCLSCHNNLIEEKEKEKNDLDKKINHLETLLGKSTNSSNQSETNQLKKEIASLKRYKESLEKILTELKKIEEFKDSVKESQKKLESKVNFLMKGAGVVAGIIIIPIMIFFLWTPEHNTNRDQTPIVNTTTVNPKEEVFPTNSTSNYFRERETTDNVNIDGKTGSSIKQVPTPKSNKPEGNTNTSVPSITEQPTYKLISIDDLYSNMGNKIQISERISQVKYADNGNVYLNIGGIFPRNKLSLVIFKNDLDKFGELQNYENKLLKIKGKLLMYKDKPQIIINYNWQLQEI